MRETTRWALLPCMIVGCAWTTLGQIPPGMPPGMPGAGAGLEEMKKRSPELYKYEKRLQDIRKKIQGLIDSYRKKEIDREAARDGLLPLVKEEREIQNDPGYIVEQRLVMASGMGAGPPGAWPPRVPPR